MKHLPHLFNYLYLFFFMGSLVINMECIAEPEVEILFKQAQIKYDNEDYDSALDLIKKAVAIAPEESRYHHLLGKCYGKIAEQAIWFKAASLARKTLKSFKKSVELDRQNIDALRDLKVFYEQAPGIVGGSKKKALKISQILAELETAN